MDTEVINTKNIMGRRSMLAGSATALGALAASVSTHSMAASSTAADSRITTVLVLEITVNLGPTEDMGMTAEGHRKNYPIIGGNFIGRGLKGSVIAGGADMSVERNDGVVLIDALYRLKTDEGDIIIIHNPGVWKPADTSVPNSQEYCRTTPSFKVASDKHQWLTQNIFVGSIDDVDENTVKIGCYLVAGI